MELILGNQQADKTTYLLQYVHDTLTAEPSQSEYALVLASPQDKGISNLLFGKYESVSKPVLDRIQIKYIDSYEELLSFLDKLLVIEPDLLPHLVALNRLNFLINLVILI